MQRVHSFVRVNIQFFAGSSIFGGIRDSFAKQVFTPVRRRSATRERTKERVMKPPTVRNFLSLSFSLSLSLSPLYLSFYLSLYLYLYFSSLTYPPCIYRFSCTRGDRIPSINVSGTHYLQYFRPICTQYSTFRLRRSASNRGLSPPP